MKYISYMITGGYCYRNLMFNNVLSLYGISGKHLGGSYVTRKNLYPRPGKQDQRLGKNYGKAPCLIPGWEAPCEAPNNECMTVYPQQVEAQYPLRGGITVSTGGWKHLK